MRSTRFYRSNHVDLIKFFFLRAVCYELWLANFILVILQLFIEFAYDQTLDLFTMALWSIRMPIFHLLAPVFILKLLFVNAFWGVLLLIPPISILSLKFLYRLPLNSYMSINFLNLSIFSFRYIHASNLFLLDVQLFI